MNEAMSNVLKALSDTHRQNILKLLSEQEMGVCEIINVIGLSQPAVSHHLKTLKQANLVATDKQGKIVFYSLNKEGLRDFFNQFHCFLQDLALFSDGDPKPSQLRQNPNLCELLGFSKTVCEE
ncbi:MAG: ArsR family transcriptional regulator [Peptococcaceae bacterium BRH_c4b]|nr:MAG: ArsR family transcriptional regulator [Peptococcaceae bacterium BRH_c4b]